MAAPSVDEAGWGSGAAHGRVPGPIRRAASRHATRRRRRDGSRRLFPTFPSFSLSLPSVLFGPHSLFRSPRLASRLARFNRLETLPIRFTSLFPLPPDYHCRLTTLFILHLVFFSFSDPLNVYHACSADPTSCLSCVSLSTFLPYSTLPCLKLDVISCKN